METRAEVFGILTQGPAASSLGFSAGYILNFLMTLHESASGTPDVLEFTVTLLPIAACYTHGLYPIFIYLGLVKKLNEAS